MPQTARTTKTPKTKTSRARAETAPKPRPSAKARSAPKATPKPRSAPKARTGGTAAASRSWSGTIDTLVHSPLGREILADALVAAAGAVAAVLVKGRPNGQQVAEAGQAAVDTGVEAASITTRLAQTATGALVEVVADAARSILSPSPKGVDGNEQDGRLDQPARREPDAGEEGEQVSLGTR